MRAKLIVIGAGASIAALSLVAIVAFFITKDAISDTVMNGLGAVATSQRQQIDSLFANYQADLDGISNDTQVRQSLRHLIATGDYVDRFVLNQTLTDRASVGSIGESYDIHDLAGNIVASSEPGHVGDSTYDPSEIGFIVNVEPSAAENGSADIRLSTPITFDGRVIGYASANHTADELNSIITRYLGRRDTGESLLIARDSNGEARFVTTLRFNESRAFYRAISDDSGNRAEIRALSKLSGAETDLVDYRGEKVFGVHHFIESASIGLVVKMDQSEALSRLDGLGRALAVVIVAISLAIVIVAYFVARHLIDPIARLTQAADRFSRGELNSHVVVESTDEIGTLGHTFNMMAGKLQTASDDLESRVEERTADLKRSNQDLEQFAYVASHDLQEPLRMVSSYTQLLSRRYTGKLDSDADEFIGFAVDGAKRMQTLINDLLTYSRAGRDDGNYAELDSCEIVQEAMQNLGSRVDDAGAVVTFDELPSVVADKQQLISIFQNLISNSIKYRSASRDVVVNISAERISNAWKFSIKDNGIGIDSAFSDRIFTIFQRLHGREEYQGTGIGLAVVKKLVERAGGTIWVESEPGEGSTFIFTVVDRAADFDSSQEEDKENYRVAS